MSLDRDLQRKILERLSAAYPQCLSGEEYDEQADAVGEKILDANLYNTGSSKTAFGLVLTGKLWST